MYGCLTLSELRGINKNPSTNSITVAAEVGLFLQ